MIPHLPEEGKVRQSTINALMHGTRDSSTPTAGRGETQAQAPLTLEMKPCSERIHQIPRREIASRHRETLHVDRDHPSESLQGCSPAPAENRAQHPCRRDPRHRYHEDRAPRSNAALKTMRDALQVQAVHHTEVEQSRVEELSIQ
jgi:hypothetical protein